MDRRERPDHQPTDGNRLALRTLADAVRIEAELAGADFSGYDIRRVDFGRAWLDGATFQNGVVTDSDFVKANLDHTGLRKQRFERCRFFRTDIVAASLDHVHFTDCDFDHANFGLSKLQDVTFERCRLSFTDWEDTHLHCVDFIDVQSAEDIGFDGAIVHEFGPSGIDPRTLFLET